MGSLVKIFPSKSFVDVLLLFLLHPDEKMYQSAIVKSTGKALMQVQRILKRLEDAGLVLRSKHGNRVYYQANRDNLALEDLKRALMKTVVFGEFLVKNLSPIKKKIRYGFIYGSTARGEEVATSDIDLFLVGDLSVRDTSKLLGPLMLELGRECNITVYSIEELKRKIKEDNIFVTEVLKGSKIWLFGDENEFAKMAE